MDSDALKQNLTKEEILSQKYHIDANTKYHNYEYLYKSMLSAMEDFSSQKWSDDELMQSYEDGQIVHSRGLRDLCYMRYTKEWYLDHLKSNK